MNTALIPVRVKRVDQHTDAIRSFLLESEDGSALPFAEAGAHIDVHLPGNLVRSYSLFGSPQVSGSGYEIAVKREETGRGGSQAVHEFLVAGQRVSISPPRNHFKLADAPHHLLLGGGIGVTPLVAMAHALHQRGAAFSFDVYARNAAQLPLHSVLTTAPWRDRVQIHLDDGAVSVPPAEVLAYAPEGSHVYFCGPAGFMSAVQEASRDWHESRVHFEYFSAPVKESPAQPASGFELVLSRSQKRLRVEAGDSVAHVLSGAGINVETVCEQGICGSCITPFLDGEPDHQDSCMSSSERATHVAVCCVRSHSPVLTLDL